MLFEIMSFKDKKKKKIELRKINNDFFFNLPAHIALSSALFNEYVLYTGTAWITQLLFISNKNRKQEMEP